MYVRPPENKKMKLPENYRGNAFGASGEYTDMPPPIRIPQPSYDLPPNEVIQNEFRENENIEPIEEPANREIAMLPEQRSEKSIRNKVDHPESRGTSDKSNSIFSMLLPPGVSSSRFPFGHGIGVEELLILGMMLLAFSQGNENGEVDNELILLLALLLFSG